MTFETSSDFRVRITFEIFLFENHDEYFEIGDGIVHEQETKLASFSGATKPSDVISVSNVVWMNIKSPCANESSIFNFTVYRATNSGIW